MDQLVHQVTVDPKVSLEVSVNKDLGEKMDLLDHRAHQEIQDLEDPLVSAVLPEPQGLEELLDSMEIEVYLELEERAVDRALLDQLDPLGLLDLEVIQGTLEPQGPLALLVPPVRLVLLVFEEKLEPLVLRAQALQLCKQNC
jgi:hypothetical protein